MDQVQEDETASVLPANHTGPGIVNVDPLISVKPLKRTPRKLRDILNRDVKNEKRSDNKR